MTCNDLAGMPLISDPGSDLVAAAVAADHAVIPIAGPSAFLLALVASGMTSSKFTFVGFLPAKAKQRQQELQSLAGTFACAQPLFHCQKWGFPLKQLWLLAPLHHA